MKDKSQISVERVERAIQLRYSPFPELSMEILTQQLNQFRTGELRPAARTWEIMFERDGELAAPALKRFESVAGLNWEIMAAKDTPEAERHAAALRYFYDHLTTTTALDADEIGDVSLLIQQVASAIAFGYSVHEVLLRVDNAVARQVTAEFRHCPVWFFEARKGRLGFLRQQWDVYGEPLEEGEWLAATGYGLMRQCSIAYAVKHFPLRDWLLYCSRFGLPGIHGETPAAKGSQEWTDFQQALAEFANNWITLTGIGPKITLIEAAKGSDTLPFADLVERSDRLYSKLFRGSDLATTSRGDGAVGANLAKKEGNILTQRDAPWVTGIFNARIDRPILRYLFNAEPLAWFKLLPPKRDSMERDLATAKFMVQHGAPISVRTARDRFGWPKPAPGQPLLKAPAPPIPTATTLEPAAGQPVLKAPAPPIPAALTLDNQPVLRPPSPPIPAALALDNNPARVSIQSARERFGCPKPGPGQPLLKAPAPPIPAAIILDNSQKFIALIGPDCLFKK